MPLVEVTLVEGREPAALRAMITELTDAIERSLGAPRASVRVVVRELPPTHWAAGDETIAERRGKEAGAAGPAPWAGGAPAPEEVQAAKDEVVIDEMAGPSGLADASETTR